MSQIFSEDSFAPTLSGDVIISIMRQHALRIYAGEKTVELRKSLPRKIPRRLFLYESNGSSAITGHAIVQSVIFGRPNEVWENVSRHGVAQDRFFSYYGDRHKSVVFKLNGAVRYKNPIGIHDIRQIVRNFRPPQNFLYLENIPDLYKYLVKYSFEIALHSCRAPWKFKLLTNKNEGDFVNLVKQHISKGYLETGRRYGEKLIEISKNLDREEGIFTRRKHIISIKHREDDLGYCVLTEKIGDCIKTGPMLIREQFTGKGLGPKVRPQIELVVKSLGFRKIYCTVPDNNLPAY